MARSIPLAGSVLALVIVTSAGCADSGDGPAPFDATAGEKTVEGPTAEELAAAESAPDTEEEFDLLEEGTDVELVETSATSVEEWEQLEGIAGDEFASLFPEASSGDIQTQGFVGGVGKAFQGIHFSVSTLTTVPSSFGKVGTFVPKAGQAYKGSVFADLPLMSEAMKAGLYEVANKLIAAAQMQGSVASFGKLSPASSDQAARLVKQFGAGKYKVATPAPLLLANGTVSSNRFFIKEAAKPRVVEITNVVTGGGKKKVLRVPKSKR